MNPLWLWVIVPFSAWLGALLMALVIANDGAYINMARFRGTMKNFADHLRNAGKEEAAEAVETISKAVSRGVFR